MKKYTAKQQKEKHRLACQKWNKKHKKYFQDYYQTNKERILEARKTYYEKHKFD